jgi:hypothetical protein
MHPKKDATSKDQKDCIIPILANKPNNNNKQNKLSGLERKGKTPFPLNPLPNKPKPSIIDPNRQCTKYLHNILVAFFGHFFLPSFPQKSTL